MFCIKSDAKKFLLKIVVKLLGNCPLQYALVRNLGWLNPQSICAKREQCIEQLKRCLAILTDSKLFSVDACEDVLNSLKNLVQIMQLTQTLCHLKWVLPNSTLF